MLKRNLLLFLFAIGIASCDNSDGNDRTPFEYRLMAGGNQVTSITFTGANGQPATVAATSLSNHWTQKIWVVKPFNASATVELNNTTAQDQEFVLQIYRNNNQVATVLDTVPAMSAMTGQVSGSISN